ncbi:MAG: ComF family protein [Clostridia bacterium]|nr:ComF family protein [Clostridia bacterium]
MAAKHFLKNLRDAIFPLNITCDLCGRDTFDGTNLCPECLKTVTFNDKVTCPVCGRKTARPEICGECKEIAPKFKQGVSALVYDGGGAKLVLKFKNGNQYLAEWFGSLLQKKTAELPACDFITYVPITKKRKFQRGYNQGELLARNLGERLDIPVKNVLNKKRDTDEQKRLSRRDRAENLIGVFEITDKKACKDKTILLVDDVMTTGATANEICRELKIAGAKAVYFAAVASVEYKQKTEIERI